jgi:hypothetical protein
MTYTLFLKGTAPTAYPLFDDYLTTPFQPFQLGKD